MLRKPHTLFLIFVLTLLLAPGAPAMQAAPPMLAGDPAQAPEASPESLLNPDGTLNLDGSYSGALALDGWQVQLDPERGPVFASNVTLGWDALGAGVDGSLNNAVHALAVSGTDVYVGGGFTDVNDNGTVVGAADYLARWDSLMGEWSALGSNGAGDGALNGTVYALAVSGTDVYVGGEFTNVNDSGTVLNEAVYVAGGTPRQGSGRHSALMAQGVAR